MPTCNCPNIGACDGSCAPYNQPAPMAAQTAPERIYLVIGEDCPQDITFRELCSRFDDGVTWCEDKIDDNSIGYVRADIHQALVEEVERLRGFCPEIPERPPHSNDASHQHPELPRYGLRWNGPGEPVSVPMPDGYWTPFHLALEAVEQAPVHIPGDDAIEWPDVDDMAHSAAQEAYSFGINHDLFKRHMQSVMFKTAGAFRRALDPLNT